MYARENINLYITLPLVFKPLNEKRTKRQKDKKTLSPKVNKPFIC